MMNILEQKINNIWEEKQNNKPFNKNEVIKYANEVIELLDKGDIFVVEKVGGKWITNEWVKKGILLSFLNDNKQIEAYNNTSWYDKCDAKFKNWNSNDFSKKAIRAVEGCFVRKGCFIDKNCVIMPSFINIGANIGEGTMIDSMSTIGSCAKIGKNCHISANACIGGVLEPLQANPVIIEDNCFIGAGTQITEGIVVGEGSVIASGVSITSGVKIIDRETGEIFNGKIPPYSVVVGGSYESRVKDDYKLNINCAIIIKHTNEKIRKKISTNELLRENI